MLRSEINSHISLMIDVFDAHQLPLPPWAFWDHAHCLRFPQAAHQLKLRGAGWLVTDFGMDCFRELGLGGITLANPPKAAPWSSPLHRFLFLQKRQRLPLHAVWGATREWHNWAGGDLLLKLYPGENRQPLEKGEVPYLLNGVEQQCPAGTVIRLSPTHGLTIKGNTFLEGWTEKAGVVVHQLGTAAREERVGCFPQGECWPPDILEDEAISFPLSLDKAEKKP